ncbi:hypothetical protein RRG08_017975 [Elysia crispata]|uniref:Uncharacterized protein n=1 Tax=Elysia crispata TaxID=231223 RepID=A0AAE1DE09_9GAST|nr:hypothetical protein RRG08_017975 [Elysia crispata]
MKGLAATICLSLLIVVVNCQTESSVVATCSQMCTQICDIWSNIMSVFSVFFGPLGPFVSVGYSICTSSCGWGCGLLG